MAAPHLPETFAADLLTNKKAITMNSKILEILSDDSKTINELRQENETLKAENEQLIKRCNQLSEDVCRAEARANEWQTQLRNYTHKLM
jgi:uncharacterized protein YoxC